MNTPSISRNSGFILFPLFLIQSANVPDYFCEKIQILFYQKKPEGLDL
jgi:hypothetical protein